VPPPRHACRAHVLSAPSSRRLHAFEPFQEVSFFFLM